MMTARFLIFKLRLNSEKENEPKTQQNSLNRLIYQYIIEIVIKASRTDSRLESIIEEPNSCDGTEVKKASLATPRLYQHAGQK